MLWSLENFVSLICNKQTQLFEMSCLRLPGDKDQTLYAFSDMLSNC